MASASVVGPIPPSSIETSAADSSSDNLYGMWGYNPSFINHTRSWLQRRIPGNDYRYLEGYWVNIWPTVGSQPSATKVLYPNRYEVVVEGDRAQPTKLPVAGAARNTSILGASTFFANYDNNTEWLAYYMKLQNRKAYQVINAGLIHNRSYDDNAHDMLRKLLWPRSEPRVLPPPAGYELYIRDRSDQVRGRLSTVRT